MKAKYYIICKQSRLNDEWRNTTLLVTTATSKAVAKKEAKKWAAELRQTLSVWRITSENDARGEVCKFAEYIGQAESAVWLRDMPQTPEDICGNWAE